jgi:integrase
MLKAWLSSRKLDDIRVIRFTKNYAIDYLDWVYLEKGLAARSWNNYVITLRTIWNWLIEKNYCGENPFLKIRIKPKQEKQRVVIPPEWIEKIVAYFDENEPNMVLVCGLVYNSFMRPGEICRTRIKDIRPDKNGIYLTGTQTKNKRSRWCLLPMGLLKRIEAMNLHRYNPDDYLVSIDLKPGKKMINTRDLDRYFNRMRKAIALPAEMQLYSFRDTGITDLKRAGHSNYFISSITGHLNSNEIETYTHDPNPQALDFVVNSMKSF